MDSQLSFSEQDPKNMSVLPYKTTKQFSDKHTFQKVCPSLPVLHVALLTANLIEFMDFYLFWTYKYFVQNCSHQIYVSTLVRDEHLKVLAGLYNWAHSELSSG